LRNNSDTAVKLFEEGYNCSQAVIGAFCDDIGMDFETAIRLSSSFGGGMGRLREVCGAVSSMFMIAGLKCGYIDPKDMDAKRKHYELIQELAQRFRDINGSIICRELLGLDIRQDIPVPEERTEKYYKKRPCLELVRCAAEIMDRIIDEKN
jgi:C_GCAxxG_C_C family probable redox protein